MINDLLSKNPEQVNSKIENILEQNLLNIIYYENSFAKAKFLTKTIEKWDIPTFYLDFDLLYSGYVKANMVPTLKNVKLLWPNSENLRENLESVIEKISMTKSVVVIDSLNGFFNILEDDDAGMLINSFIMMLASSAKNTKSIILVGSLSKLNEENEFVLHSSGRHVIDNKHMEKIQLVESNGLLKINILNFDNSTKSSFTT
jgi:archaellum biogenesis ATPase FlaH|tara:strand:- start:138 stop:743 length:606 start_codon:yes stop_codon:yes gene_type:complete